MDGQMTAVFIICLVAQQIEELRVHDADNEIEGIIRITDDNK